ncbi:DUF5704 domain-containing protein, partial [Anaerosporobacter sp.]|uniref:DUF5704 domain-containing protein n=1 Tax=Anaerosporobacter sp. TaxID=1872529 RepID=UPI00286F38BD
NGIFGVYNSGNFKKGPYYTLSGISGAESWGTSTLNDFKQYFNIPVEYHPTKLDVDVPVSVEYHTEEHELMYIKDLEKAKLDEKVTYTFPETYRFKGKKYILYRSYYMNMSKPTSMQGKLKKGVDGATLAQVMNREVEATDTKGLKLIAMYKPEDDVDEPEDDIMPDSILVPLEDPSPEVVIKADVRGNEQFDVEQGVPTTESVYVNATSEEYLYTYKFVKEVVTVPYTIVADKTYLLSWQSWEKVDTNEETGEDIYDYVEKSEESTKTQEVIVERKVAYWRVSYLRVYTLDGVRVKNEALPESNLYVKAVGINAPRIETKISKKWQDHVLDPEGYEENMTLVSENIVGGYTKPLINDEDIAECVEKIVGVPTVTNDKLVFNGVTIMDDSETLKEGPRPSEIPETKVCNENAIYRKNLVIPRDKANMEYESNGVVQYNTTTTILDSINVISGLPKNYDVEVNSIIVHTPTVCDAKVTDLKAYNQMVNPETNRASLILDKTFTIRLSTTGSHNDYPGYGDRDYAKYIAYQQAKFPFDVYKGTRYIKANTWVTMDSEETTFYLPTWVNEGNYEIQFEAPAINCDANNGYDKTEYLANYIIDDYVAIDSIFVNVSGRVYGLTIYDISDYPTWQSVFRNKDSLTLTGTNYSVGVNNQNGLVTGRLAKYTFPLVNGSHPTDDTVGAVKLGYCTRFKFTTVGNMYNEEDYIKITPRFYYVDRKGQNRQEVDLYYTETFEAKRNYMIKVGSDKDKLNKKMYVLGSEYWQVPEIEIANTAFVTEKTSKEIKKQNGTVFTFGDIGIDKTFRTYIGSGKYTPTGTIPATVDSKTVIQSVQNWYGEYYLPSDVHVLAKDYDLSAYIKNKGGVDFTEDIWLDKGYIIVNFDIVTYQIEAEQANLSYINKENALNGYCNMWKLEGSQVVKTDSYGNTFEFKYGDYVMYAIDKSAAIDYKSGGTH